MTLKLSVCIIIVNLIELVTTVTVVELYTTQLHTSYPSGIKEMDGNIASNAGPSEAGRLKPPHFFTTFINYNFIHYKHTCNHDSLNHARAFYNIKYMNPQSIILSIGGVAFFRIDLLNYLTTAL